MLINKKLPITYILKNVRAELTYVFIISIGVYLLTHLFKESVPAMPLTIPTFIGTAISILLSFKLNQSYDRWWEARKAWGSIVNDSRSLVMQLKSFIGPEHQFNIKTIAYRQIAWCYSLGQNLRNLNPTDNIEAFVSEKELLSLQKHHHVPLVLLSNQSADLTELRKNHQIELFSQFQLDNTLVRLCDSMGKVERIKSTVFPVTYRIFLQFMIYIFVVTLSISLTDIPFYFEIPLLIVISGVFFLLEKTAALMQEPFSNLPTDTPMTAIARNIEINIREILGEKELPKPYQMGTFYLD